MDNHDNGYHLPISLRDGSLNDFDKKHVMCNKNVYNEVFSEACITLFRALLQIFYLWRAQSPSLRFSSLTVCWCLILINRLHCKHLQHRRLQRLRALIVKLTLKIRWNFCSARKAFQSPFFLPWISPNRPFLWKLTHWVFYPRNTILRGPVRLHFSRSTLLLN